jgi:hypothetical protein
MFFSRVCVAKSAPRRRVANAGRNFPEVFHWTCLMHSHPPDHVPDLIGGVRF